MPTQTIKDRRDFLSAASQGRKFIASTLILQMHKRPDNHPVIAPEPRFGFTVTKKMGNSVARNRIKRRLREAVRKVSPKHIQAGYDYVIISRNKCLKCDFTEITRDMEFAFSRIPYIKDNQPKPTTQP